jgi:hypothetical protein
MPGLQNTLNNAISAGVAGFVEPHRNFVDVDQIMNGGSDGRVYPLS